MAHAKKIGFWTVSSLVIGGMVGTGVFMLPSALAKFGTFGLWSWAITGVGSISLALLFAGLSARVSKTGGPHAFIMEAFGEKAGFLAAWGYWLAGWIAVPGIVIGAVSNLIVLTPYAGSKEAALIMEVGILSFVAFLNLKGMYFAGIADIVFTVLKVVPLLILPLFALQYVDLPARMGGFVPDISPVSAITQASVIAMWGYLGVEAATTPAGSIINPKKTIPQALIFGTIVTTIIYVFCTYVIMGNIDITELQNSTTPFVDLTAKVFGTGYDSLVSVTIALVCLGTLQSTVMTNSQISYGAALDKLFPKFFTQLNSSHASIWSILLPIVVIMIVFAFINEASFNTQFKSIIEMATVGYLAVYLFCSLALTKILLSEASSLGRNFYILISIISLMFSVFILANVDVEAIGYFALMLFAGVPVYLWVKNGNNLVN